MPLGKKNRAKITQFKLIFFTNNELSFVHFDLKNEHFAKFHENYTNSIRIRIQIQILNALESRIRIRYDLAGRIRIRIKNNSFGFATLVKSDGCILQCPKMRIFLSRFYIFFFFAITCG